LESRNTHFWIDWSSAFDHVAKLVNE